MLKDVQTGSTYDMSPLQKSQNTMTDITSLFVTAGINDIAFDAASDAWFRGIANRLIPESCQANPVYQNDSFGTELWTQLSKDSLCGFDGTMR